jgi:hypothetical protein
MTPVGPVLGAPGDQPAYFGRVPVGPFTRPRE